MKPKKYYNYDVSQSVSNCVYKIEITEGLHGKASMKKCAFFRKNDKYKQFI